MNRVYTDVFHARAKLPDGQIEEMDGTLIQCSVWASEMIRKGSMEIDIRTKSDREVRNVE